MKLIFLLQKQAWFVEHAQAWYRVNDMNEVALGLSGLALNMINQHDLIEQPHQAGRANVVQTDSTTLKIALTGPDNKPIHEELLKLDQNVLLGVDWKTKQFRDGWMSSDAMVTLDNVSEMYLDVYLPANSSSDGKVLHILNQKTGSTDEVWIARDRQSRIPILVNGLKGKVEFSLKCAPEEIDRSIDPRQLGFVLIAEDARPI